MTLYLDPRSNVWYARERVDGKRTATRLGTLAELPTRQDALRAAEKLSIKWTPEPDIRAVIERYIAGGMPDRYTTKSSYLNKLNGYIAPRWGADKFADIRPMQLDQWFRELDVAPTTKAGIKNVFAQLWRFAQLNELVSAQHNPLALIRIKGSSKRLKRPQILTPEECRQLLENVLVEPFRTMIYTALCLGIRRSELTGLIWSDISWLNGTIMIQRSVVDNHSDTVKTEASEKALPLDPALMAMLSDWRGITAYKADSDWVWASPKQGGAYPFYPNYIQKHYLKPAGIASGLGEHIGWHTLRHTYRALLDRVGTTVGVQKDLMRHSNVAMTMNTYGGALPDDQRTAQSAVTRLVIQ